MDGYVEVGSLEIECSHEVTLLLQRNEILQSEHVEMFCKDVLIEGSEVG